VFELAFEDVPADELSLPVHAHLSAS
jgi:hypothetical protein